MKRTVIGSSVALIVLGFIGPQSHAHAAPSPLEKMVPVTMLQQLIAAFGIAVALAVGLGAHNLARHRSKPWIRMGGFVGVGLVLVLTCAAVFLSARKEIVVPGTPLQQLIVVLGIAAALAVSMGSHFVARYKSKPRIRTGGFLGAGLVLALTCIAVFLARNVVAPRQPSPPSAEEVGLAMSLLSGMPSAGFPGTVPLGAIVVNRNQMSEDRMHLVIVKMVPPPVRLKGPVLTK